MPVDAAVLELNRVSAGPLSALSLSMRAGMVTAVVGPVGSGRTTIAKVVCGVLTPSAGRVVLDGVDITEVDAASRARFGVGWVRQRPRPFATLTVQENILVAASAARRWGGREAVVRTGRLLERFDLVEVADLPAWQLDPERSARLEVVRVLAAPRRLIVVDELSNDLAADHRAELAAALVATAQLGGAVLWLDAPGPLDVRPDQLVLLAGGRIVAQGPPDAVEASAEYRLLRNQELVR
ncbi:MAG: ATP-binding cassette domain-containing protein [Acidimicrobiales bacterium]|nr:ATP-binding cassette domain-containing protein [Acidimicrobiales bacterium]